MALGAPPSAFPSFDATYLAGNSDAAELAGWRRCRPPGNPELTPSTPNGLDVTAPDIDAEAQRQKTALLFRNGPLAFGATIVNAALISFVNVLFGAATTLAVAWWAVVFAVAVGRFALTRRFHAVQPDAASADAWRRRYIVGTFLAAATWSAGSLTFAWHAPESARLFVALVVAGMVAGGVPILAPVPLAFGLFANVIVLPLGIESFVQAATVADWVFGALILTFLGVVLGSARSLHDSLDMAIRLGLKNAEMVRTLERARGAAESALEQRSRAEEEIRNLAYFDSLTGLPNRRLLLDRLGHAIDVSGRTGSFGALMMLDLDHFKSINDTQGHDTGDRLLVEVARRLRECLRHDDTVCRLGGDEYVVLLEGLGDDEQVAAGRAENVAEKLRDALQQPYAIAGGETEYFSSTSIGLALFGGAAASAEVLLKQADVALYQAKDSGRNAARFFNPAMQSAIEQRSGLESALRRSLDRDEFHLHYQPQFDAEGRLFGAEALIRWQPAGQGIVSPAQFIPLAEESGLIQAIGRWVLETACRQLKAWAQDPRLAALTLSINVSARQVHRPDFVRQVNRVLADSGVEPSRLMMELTEGVVVDDVESVISRMEELARIGVRFALDDFGIGYSSLFYLKRLPLHQIKIDRSFVADIPDDPNDAAIVRAILAMSRSLGLQVVAEGVETETQREFLGRHRCPAFQGYLFGRPMPIEEFERFAQQRLAQAA